MISSFSVFGSGTRRYSVHLPTYVLHVDEGDPEETIEVPCISSSSSAPFGRRVELMNTPYIPHYANWNKPKDTNLITLYGIKVSVKYDVTIELKNQDPEIIIDCKNAVKPNGYALSIEEVLTRVVACSKLNFEIEKVSIINKKVIK